MTGTDSSLPEHIGIIMDGNGRWAQNRGLPRTLGHKEGGKAFKNIFEYCCKKYIKYVTFYAFSTENKKRPREEINALMGLFDSYIKSFFSEYADKNIRLIFLGDKSWFSDNLRREMIRLEETTRDCTGTTLMLAMNYGGRDDIVCAARKAAELSAEGFLKPGDIDEKFFSSLLYTSSAPDVDLMIRTGGEYRISNFLLWQCAYAEFYFTDTLWPDFGENDLDKALDAFAARKRRFGGV